MLRNIIFDMGGVLIQFDPEYFVRCVDLDNPADREILLQEIFRSKDWKLIDKGVIDEAELERRVFERIPERLQVAAHRMIFEWNQLAHPIEGMAELIRACKAAGMGIYLLSNASLRQPEYWPSIPGSECFDGTLVSAYELCVKPDVEIYRRALNKFGLKAEESIFIDDMAVNTEAAERVGIRGVHFRGDAAQLREALRALGVAV